MHFEKELIHRKIRTDFSTLRQTLDQAQLKATGRVRAYRTPSIFAELGRKHENLSLKANFEIVMLFNIRYKSQSPLTTNDPLLLDACLNDITNMWLSLLEYGGRWTGYILSPVNRCNHIRVKTNKTRHYFFLVPRL